MFDVGLSEIALILIIAAILLGPQKIPEIAKTIGKLLAQARKATDDFKEEINREIKLIDEDSKKETQTPAISDIAPKKDEDLLKIEEEKKKIDEMYKKLKGEKS